MTLRVIAKLLTGRKFTVGQGLGCRPITHPSIPHWRPGDPKLGLPIFLLLVVVPIVMGGFITEPDIRFGLIVLGSSVSYAYATATLWRALPPAKQAGKRGPLICFGLSLVATVLSLSLLGGLKVLSEPSIFLVRIRISPARSELILVSVRV